MPTPSAAELAFAIQSARGTPAASSTQRVYLTGGSLPAPVKRPVATATVTATRSASPLAVASVPAAGSPMAIIRPKMIGALLYAVLGAKSVSGASDPWTHVFTVGATTPFLTFWRYAAGILNERIVDARVARLTISGSAGGPMQASFDALGGSGAYRTAQETTATVETADPFVHGSGRGALKIEGVAVTSIRTFTLTIDAAVTLVETLAGPIAFMSGKPEITLTVDQALVDVSLWNRMAYGTATPGNLAAPTLTPLELAGSPAGVEFTFTEQASPERSLKLAMTRVAVMSIDGFDPAPAYGQARSQVTLRALAPAGSPLTATLKNSQSSY